MIYLFHRFISSPVPFRTAFYDVCNALPLINNSCVALFLTPSFKDMANFLNWTRYKALAHELHINSDYVLVIPTIELSEEVANGSDDDEDFSCNW